MGKRHVSESVRILEWRLGYYPRCFRWRGHQFEVLKVEKVTTVRRDWPRKSRRRLYVLRTQNGVFELSHDLIHDIWQVRRAPSHWKGAGRPVRSVTRRTRRLANERRLAMVR